MKTMKITIYAPMNCDIVAQIYHSWSPYIFSGRSHDNQEAKETVYTTPVMSHACKEHPATSYTTTTDRMHTSHSIYESNDTGNDISNSTDSSPHIPLLRPRHRKSLLPTQSVRWWSVSTWLSHRRWRCWSCTWLWLYRRWG